MVCSVMEISESLYDKSANPQRYSDMLTLSQKLTKELQAYFGAVEKADA